MKILILFIVVFGFLTGKSAQYDFDAVFFENVKFKGKTFFLI